MPRFSFKPESDLVPPLEFEANDPAVALSLAGRNGFSAGRMLQDGVYLCLIRRAGERVEGSEGYWIVSHQGREV